MSSLRITVSLAKRPAAELAKLVEDTGMSKTEIVNRSLNAYALLADKLDAGYELAFRNPHDDTVTVVHLL